MKKHRAKRSLLESAHGSMATVANSAGENNTIAKQIHLTPTGLLMEGVNTQNPVTGIGTGELSLSQVFTAVSQRRPVGTPRYQIQSKGLQIWEVRQLG